MGCPTLDNCILSSPISFILFDLEDANMCIWNVEADIYDFDSETILDILYSNNYVDSFMQAKDSMGIAACKGMGKTFLLKSKRIQMMKEQNSVLTLPKNRMVDSSGPITLDRMHISFLSNYSNWVSIWIFCISTYLLSLDEFEKLKIVEIENYKNVLPKSILELLEKKYIGIFNVLHVILLQKSKKILNEVTMASSILFDIVQKIQTPIAMFVDKLEEPFNKGYYAIPGSSRSSQGNYNSSIWAYAQLSFAESVYLLYSSRNHLKIFYSIRKEALYRGEEISTEYQKLRYRIVSLEYSDQDLYKMFCLYILKEDPNELCCPELAHSNPIKALVGIDTISHRSGANERIWNYIYRHTFQRPRDIMEMCQSIHSHIVKNSRVSENIISRTRILRHWINEISSMECMSYLCNLDPFMEIEANNISFKECILKFVKTLPTNIYTYTSIMKFCHEANDLYYSTEDDIDCDKCNRTHFFSTLYNIGLLGLIHKSVNDNSYYNQINHIGKSNYQMNSSSLPKGVIYYLHPGLANIVQKEREVAGHIYIPCRYVINDLENEVPFEQVRFMEDTIISITGNLNDHRVFLSSTGRDFSDERKKITALLKNKGYEVYAFENPNFPQMESHEYESGIPGGTHDHCIDVMLTCKHVIYFFTGRFGGEYAGEKYKFYYEKEDVIDDIPSVSFMEYLVAKNHEKNVKVYVDEKVDIARGEYIANNQPKEYNSRIVDNTRVFKQLGYFNALGNGTWYDKYNDTNTLEDFINAHF